MLDENVVRDTMAQWSFMEWWELLCFVKFTEGTSL
jgi:hypothetical protein